MPGWSSTVAMELERVERTLESVLNSDISSAYDLSMRLLTSGGKRIRPSLLVICALASGECDPDRMAYLAAATELVHMASLVHDDVVDETHERRGASTASECYGNKISVLGGDYLLSKAFYLLSTHGSPEILRALSGTAVQMTESEILQASGEGDLSVWEANYWRIIHGKTADFMGSCCESGAYLAGADQQTRESLREYGVQLGLAFQITDDVLDIAGDRALTGKETGTDLMHGKFTLPVLLALRDGDQDGSLREALAKGWLTPSEAEEVAARVIACGGLDSARLAAVDCADAAVKQLSGVTRSEYTDALSALAGFVISREG
jgi:octaprenyl-diphosphate synthase